MHLFRYVWIFLLASCAVLNAAELVTLFDWDSLLLMFGFGLTALAALTNHTLIWPHGVAPDYTPRIPKLISRLIFGWGQALIYLGFGVKMVQAFMA
jgi:hypothetical protein